MALKEGQELPLFRIWRWDIQGYPGMAGVDCVRCGNSFAVVISEFYRPRRYMSRGRTEEKEFTITGRPCPYCFRASRLPPRPPVR